MIKLDDKLIENDLLPQNPWWRNIPFIPGITFNFHRDLFSVLFDRVKNRELITSLVGLRRVGKSTLIRQIIRKLLESGQDPKSILYFLFEDQIIKNVDLGDKLRQIIEYQVKNNPNKKSYLFLDEIQYVDSWNSILKFCFDIYPQLKFVVSGSASLFIHTKAKESLTGRIQELTLRPMGYGEYLRMTDKDNSSLHFLEYLSWGEFPYLVKLPNWEEKKEYVSDFIFKKVVENDLPKLKKVYGSELSSMLKVLTSYPGQNIEILNLAKDLKIAPNTAREYLSLLEKTHLVSQIYNLGIGFRERSTRQRKVYPTSVNAYVLPNVQGLTSDIWRENMGNIIETFVYNHLLRQNLGEIYFFRQRQVKEVDFIQLLPETKIPIEVKYQNQIRISDLDNILYYCKKEKLKKAIVISKFDEEIKEINGVDITFRQARSLLD